MATTYPNTSPWATTAIVNQQLGFLSYRDIGSQPDDPLYEVEPKYTYRPDLLAYDLYGNSKLWWVFLQRNPDTIQDPIYDFVPGLIIRLPKKGTLFSSLGI